MLTCTNVPSSSGGGAIPAFLRAMEQNGRKFPEGPDPLVDLSGICFLIRRPLIQLLVFRLDLFFNGYLLYT